MKRRIFGEPAVAGGVALNAAALGLAMLMFHRVDESFTRLTREDDFVEWLQFLIFIALGALLAFAAADRFQRPGRKALGVAGLACFALLVFFAAFEEVSWFQRALGVESPAFFLEHNRQAETNLHNLGIGGMSLHKDIIVKLIFVAGMTHNLILPALAIRRPAIRAWVERWGFYLPPLSVSFVTGAFIAVAQLHLKHPRSGEITELLGAVHYFSTAAAAYLFGVLYAGPIFRDEHSRARVGWLFVTFLGFLVLVAWLLGSMSHPYPGRPS